MKKSALECRNSSLPTTSEPIALSGQKGFTLIEVLMSMVIIGICVAGIMYPEQQKWKLSGTSKRISAATRVIQNKIENLRIAINADTTRFPPIDTSFTTDGINVAMVVTAITNGLTPPDSLPNVRKVVLTGRWTYSGKTDSVKVTTYVSKKF